MSVLFAPKAKFGRFKQFRDDVRGIVTVQMVMFSVFIFGGIGLMMDFGRAYSAHSQMQGYIDQVALAAAKELDGKPDAISRAQAAANLVTKSSSFVTGNGAFGLKDLVFMTKSPTDSNGNFSPTLAATYNTTQPSVAKYVLAIANTSSVSVKLLNFGSKGNDKISDIDIAATAVATSRTVSCGGLSPIVMCNPFENSTTTSWETEMSDSIGYRMKLTADITDGSKPRNFTGSGTGPLTPTGRIQLGLLKSPDTLMDVRNTICTNAYKIPGRDTGIAMETLKDACMLATIDAGLSCVNDQVAFKAAHPRTLTTGLNVPFDMYDEFMGEILDSTEDFTFTHSFPSSLGWASSISRRSLFYPDRVPSHGRMKRADFEKHLDNRQYSLDNSNIHPFFKGPMQTAIDNSRTAYGVDGSISDHSRQNHIFDTGMRTEWGPAQVRTCLNVENCDSQQGSPYATIYNAKPGLDTIKNYASALYDTYLRQQAAAASPGTYPNWYDVAEGLSDATNLVNNKDTYYSFYSDIERMNANLQVETAVRGHDGSDTNGHPTHVAWNSDVDGNGSVEDHGVPGSDDIYYGTEGTQTSAVNFPTAYSPADIGSEERRVQRITVVNCEDANGYTSVTGDSASSDGSISYSDTYIGEVVDVIDVFMLTPPQVTECSPVISPDPDSNYLCPNTDIAEVHLDVEVVDSASMNAVNFDARYYAVLVH